MAAQVVDSSNLVQFVQTGKVPAFKPPEPSKPDAGTPAAPSETKANETSAQPRSVDGKFTSAKESDTTTPAAPSNDKKAGGERVGDPKTDATQAAIDKKHRQMREAEERERRETLRAIKAEERAEQLQRELEASRSKSGPAAASEAPKEPKAEDFKTVGEYTDALVTYRVDQRLREEKTKAEREAEQRESEARAREFGKRVAATREKHADFDDVLGSIKGTNLDRVHSDVTEYIQESDHGAELLYHLAKNPDVLDRLQKFSPRRFIAELGKLETKFESTPPAKEHAPTLTEVAEAKSPVSKAPAPIAPLDTAGIAPVAKKPDQMSVAELREYRRQQDREQRAARR